MLSHIPQKPQLANSSAPFVYSLRAPGSQRFTGVPGFLLRDAAQQPGAWFRAPFEGSLKSPRIPMRQPKPQATYLRGTQNPKTARPRLQRLSYHGTPDTGSCFLLKDSTVLNSLVVRRPKFPKSHEQQAYTEKKPSGIPGGNPSGSSTEPHRNPSPKPETKP